MKFVFKINNIEGKEEDKIIEALSIAFKELGVLHEANMKDATVKGELQTSRNWSTMEYLNTQVLAKYFKLTNSIEFTALTNVTATNFKRVVFNLTYLLYKNDKIELDPIKLPEDIVKEPLNTTEDESNIERSNYKPFSDLGFYQQAKLMLMCYSGLAILMSPFFIYPFVSSSENSKLKSIDVKEVAAKKYTYSDAQNYMVGVCKNINQELLQGKTIKYGENVVFIFLSQKGYGDFCISTVTEYKLEVISADCGKAEKVLEFENLPEFKAK